MANLLEAQEQNSSTISYAAMLDAEKAFLQSAIDVANAALPSPEEHFKIAQRIADTRSPSGEVSYTRGKLIQELVNETAPREDVEGLGIITFYENFAGTGATAVYIGNKEKQHPTIVYTHADEIAHDLGLPIDEDGKREGSVFALTPLHANRLATGSYVDAEVYTYNETSTGERTLALVAQGRVLQKEKGKDPVFELNGDQIENFHYDPSKGYRVVYQPLGHESSTRLRLLDDGDTVEGQVDNCIGDSDAVASWGPVIRLAQADLTIGVLYVFDDKEEGVPDPPQAFGKGGRGLEEILRTSEQFAGSTRIIVDGHDGVRGRPFPTEPVVADVVSNSKGPVMSLPRKHHIHSLTALINTLGGPRILFDREAGIKTSRSGEQGASDAGISENKIVVMGYVENSPHFDYAGEDIDTDRSGRPSRASLEENQNLAKAITIFVAADHKGVLNIA